MNIMDIKIGNKYKIATQDKLKPHGLFNYRGDPRKILKFKSKYLTWKDCNDKEICVVGYQAGFIAAYLTEFKGVSFLINPTLIENIIQPSQKSLPNCICDISDLLMRGCKCGAFKAESKIK